MKRAWIVVVVAVGGCTQSAPVEEPSAEPCDIDADCAAGICARTHECVADADVQMAHVVWTVAGRVADPDTCSNSPDVTIEFWTAPEATNGMGQVAAFGPISCALGTFTVDRLPTWYWIGGVRTREAGMWVPLDASGTAKIDLPY